MIRGQTPEARSRCFFVLLLCAMAAAAQQKTQAEIRGQKIIDDAIIELGGNAFLGMQDRIESGRAYSFYHEQISGLSVAKIYTRYITVAPDKTGQDLGVREKEVFGKSEDTSVLFLENKGYDISWRGVKDMADDQFNRYRESTLRNVLYILRMRLHEPGMIFEFRGSDVFENQPVNIVDITDSENRLTTVYFHQSTKLPVRQMYARHNAQKERDEEVTLFSRYREENGVMWPHNIRRERNGDRIYEIFADSVQINKDVTDNIFTVPDTNSLPAQGKPAKKK